MSHSVRRLWAGAIMLLMGCQSVPSTMTSLFDAAHKRVPHDSVQESTEPTFASASEHEPSRPLQVEEEGERDPDKVTFDIADRENLPSQRLSKAMKQPPENGTESKIAADFQSADAEMSSSDSTSADVAPTQNHSTFPDLSSRWFGSDSDEPPTEPSQTSVHPLLSFDESTFPPAEDETDSSIIQVGHEESIDHPRRHPLLALEQTLEAPTPFSAITRRTAAVEPVAAGDVPRRDEAIVVEKRPTEDGFVGSLFDVFGIGGDRAGQAGSDTPTPLRRANVARLERPPVDGTPKKPAPSVEALTKSLQTVHWQEELERLTALLETQLAHQTAGESDIEQDYYIRQQVALRLLYLIGSRRPEALQAIPDIDADQQEFWTELLWALSNIFDDEAMPDRGERARETVTRLRAALTHITPLAGLRLTRTHFCRQINGFGSYVTFDIDEFSSGQSVLIYTEVENFVSRPISDGEFVTTLQTTLRIQQGDLTGPIVFEEDLPATEDSCLSPRRDYFHSYRITLPPKLTPGPHVLTLTVRDQVSQKLSTASLNFVVR